jgi:hypothetical protein
MKTNMATSTTKSLCKVLENEKAKNEMSTRLSEVEELFAKLDRVIGHEKSTYSIPLADTLGKGLDAILNTRLKA